MYNMGGSINQSPEQIARDNIDKQLRSAGWAVQDKDKINWNESIGIAVREYQTNAGPADYLLFVERRPVGLIEAKKEDEGFKLISHEPQAESYATSKLKYLDNDPLPFIYESTGTITRFTDYRDPKSRSRPVFAFHRPETFKTWLKEGKSLRARLMDIPELPESGLRDCQIKAIRNLEKSFKENKPRSLIQMATGSGKTHAAITSIYRLLKFADAKRVLFLVDTRNLGEQAEQEFLAYQPSDDNRKFTELYNVQRLHSNYISSDSQVCISTIQRLYSILKGEELDEETEEKNEINWEPKEPVVYDEKIPIEQFDFIVIDECHRSIYNLWKQVLDYFDAFLIGLTATPDKRTFGFFNENVVSEYSHEEAVADGVNVGYDVYIIETENEFCNKITYKTEEDPKSVLTRFRNAYNPRIAVTVAMISVGIDVKPLECLLFMRDVKSKGYFEQMNWLRMMKEHIAISFHIEVDDLDYTPFDAHGGRGMMFQLFGNGMKAVISEMNEALAV